MFTDFRGSGQNGHAFLAIDIARFLPLDTYYDRLETLIGIVTQSGTSERPIRIPGQARWDACDRATRDGIPLEPSTARALEALAGRYGIPVPWTGVPPFFGLPSPLAGPALVPGPFEMTDPRPLQAS